MRKAERLRNTDDEEESDKEFNNSTEQNGAQHIPSRFSLFIKHFMRKAERLRNTVEKEESDKGQFRWDALDKIEGRFMNQYFLLIACLQLWPLITPVNPASTWGPLVLIFSVSATKEAWDDYNRYLSDKKANEKQVWIVNQGIRKH
ncbi:unnamed protein product [Camellia sinensis]